MKKASASKRLTRHTLSPRANTPAATEERGRGECARTCARTCASANATWRVTIGSSRHNCRLLPSDDGTDNGRHHIPRMPLTAALGDCVSCRLRLGLRLEHTKQEKRSVCFDHTLCVRSSSFSPLFLPLPKLRKYVDIRTIYHVSEIQNTR